MVVLLYFWHINPHTLGDNPHIFKKFTFPLSGPGGSYQVVFSNQGDKMESARLQGVNNEKA
jgi:hypothetical protein